MYDKNTGTAATTMEPDIENTAVTSIAIMPVVATFSTATGSTADSSTGNIICSSDAPNIVNNVNTENAMTQRFIVRMKMRPFMFFRKFKITPVQHTKLLPSPLSNNPPVKEEEQIQQEQEWKAMWQHFNDFMENERKDFFAKINPDRGQMICRGLILVAILYTWFFDSELVHSMVTLYSLAVAVLMIILKDVIRTSITYSCNTNDNVVDSNRQNQSTVITNRTLLQVNKMSSFTTVSVFLGSWMVVASVIYSMKQYELSVWYYVIFPAIPISLVSLYVFYHIGDCRSVFLSYSNRFMYTTIRLPDLTLKKSYFEIKRYNNVSAYFTLHPRVNYDFGIITVDVYYKSTNNCHSQMTDSSGNGLPIMSLSSDPGMTKRRGTGNNGFITMIDTCGEQQQPQIDHCRQYDDDNDGLATPLLVKDSSSTLTRNLQCTLVSGRSLQE